MDIKMWKEKLHEPGSEYRSAPFWGFNGKFEEENLKFQVREMKNAGMGGFFVHSREGLETPYLSDEWMQSIAHTIDEAKRQDMEVWIYDEDKWPSGSAGGLVSRTDPQKYSAKAVTLEVLEPADYEKKQNALIVGADCSDGRILGIYPVVLDGDRILDMPENKPEKTGRYALGKENNVNAVLILRQETSGTSEWYNGFAPSDTLNPEAVKTFLNLTHEKYKERFGAEFGKRIKGFFTDEPNCCDFFSIFTEGRPWLTYTEQMPEYFLEKRGYELIPDLPLLFFDGEGAEKLRHDYWRTIAELFQEAFMKQMYEWCDGNGLEVTGHMLYENDLGYQARVCGSAMTQYKYLHRPGVDLLGEQTKEYLTIKQTSSVAHQYGRKHTITETYGCTGWEFSFEGQKWLGDWQFVQGIDRRCQHLALYSIAGCRKRDYPPVFGYQTTWWKQNHLLEQYFGRLSTILGETEVIRDVLVLHPMSSIWTKARSAGNEDLSHMEMNMGWLDEHITSVNEWGESYNRLAKMLSGAHIDFDFGDEILLSQDGKVEGNAIILGQCAYHTVIVPRIVTMFEHTSRLLSDFAANGGKLIITKPLPTMIEGAYKEGLEEELLGLPGVILAENYEELIRITGLEPDLGIHIQNKDGQEDTDLLASVRKTDQGYAVLVVNNDRDKSHPVTITLPVTGAVEQYDPWTDSWTSLQVESARQGMRFFAELGPAGSRVFFADLTRQPMKGSVEFPYVHPHYADPVFAALGPRARVRRTMENVLTLDVCSYRIGKEEDWSDPMQVWQAQRELRDRLQMQQVYYNGAPQRYFWLQEPAKMDGTLFELKFLFEAKDTIESQCCLVMEKPEALQKNGAEDADEFQISMDGVTCKLTTEWFMDRDMKKILLPKMNAGMHEIRVTGYYTQAVELEDIFITGHFAVDPERKISKEIETLHFGDWCFQGNYHYPGSMIYSFDLPGKEPGDHRYLLKMGSYKGTFGIIRLNGETAGYLLGKTTEDPDLTPFMKEEGNLLEIELFGSPRNMFGPFHQTYTGCSRISWADFRTEGRFFTPDYVLEPYGLMEQITISVI